MPRPRLPHQVRIFDRDYTLEAAADARSRLDAIARELDLKMRTFQARQPDAAPEQLAVLAALDLLQSCDHLHESAIARELTALEHKIERLEALILPSTPVTP